MSAKKPKICIVSVSPYVSTGYGMGIKDILDMLMPTYDCCMLTQYGQYGYVSNYTGRHGGQCTMYPLNSNNSNKNMLADLPGVKWLEKYDIVLSFLDLFRWSPANMQDYWAAMLMVDSEPMMRHNLQPFGAVDMCLCTTQWAEDTINPDMSTNQVARQFPIPISELDYYLEDNAAARDWFKKMFKITGTLGNIVSCNAANYSDGGMERKNFPELIRWWKSHAERNPNDYLYLHTDVTGQLGGGTEMSGLLSLYDTPADNIRFANPAAYGFGMLGRSYLRNIYNASDVMVVPSHSEGQGMPYCESAMCGAVPVGNDWGAGGEVVKNCGGIGIECRERYYTGHAAKSFSDCDQVGVAVNKAIALARQPDTRRKLAKLSTAKYSCAVLKPVLHAIVNECMELKEEKDRS